MKFPFLGREDNIAWDGNEMQAFFKKFILQNNKEVSCVKGLGVNVFKIFSCLFGSM